MNSIACALILGTASLSMVSASGVVAPTGRSGLVQPDVTAAVPVKIQDDRPVIRVSGTGEVQRRPDYAVVFVGVEMRDRRAQDASDKAGAGIAAIVKAVDGLKISGMQIQTSEVRLTPAYKWEGGDQQRILLGYDASSMVKVRVDDPKAVGKVIDAATGAGANRIDGVSFEISGALEARQEALRLAAKAARDKAETLAEALDMRIHCVIEASTTSSEPNLWMNTMANSMSRAPAEGGFDGSVEPGFVTIRAEAHVTFGARAR
ncbi:MAG: SIMPL domain-containing protein [Phycisphaerales bacterium]